MTRTSTSKGGKSMRRRTWWNDASAVILFGLACAIGAEGQTFTTLLTFEGTNGGHPSGKLVQGEDGNLYGVTSQGGAYSCPPQAGCGTIFRVTPGGSLTTILSFNDSDGAGPFSGLTLATDGNFYGTTSGGLEPYLYGSIFKITPGGDLTSLNGFSNTENG